MMDYSQLRGTMVEQQIAARGVRSEAVLNALRKVPRELFLPERLREFAYDDAPLPIEAAQTISQPYIVALMTEALALKGGENVLEIGTGSGYAAAVLAEIAGEVYTVERIEQLADTAALRLADLGYKNVHVRHGDGTLGWPEHAPYDAIIVAAGGPRMPARHPHRRRPAGPGTGTRHPIRGRQVQDRRHCRCSLRPAGRPGRMVARREPLPAARGADTGTPGRWRISASHWRNLVR
jgi:protein-L-isoaspartate(D-aspartate) O-methyltransferase